MYHLFRSLYLHATSKEEYSVLLLGLDNAGKTTLLNQIKNLYQTTPDTSAAVSAGHGDGDAAADPKAGNTVPTVGQNVAVINQPEMYVKIWDVGGQMTLRRLWTSYYKSCHAVIFVVDSSDLGTLEQDIEYEDNIAEDSVDRGATDGDSLVKNDAFKSSTTPGSEDGFGTNRKSTIGRKWHGRRKSSYNVYAKDSVGNGLTNATTASGDIDTSVTDTAISKSPVDERPGKMQRINTTTLNAHLGQGRLDECRAVLESVLGHPDMSGIPILVLANKQDREDCIEVVRIKEGFVRKVFEGDKGGMIRDSRVLPVSALKGTGVRDAVEWVKKRMVGNKQGRAPVMR